MVIAELNSYLELISKQDVEYALSGSSLPGSSKLSSESDSVSPRRGINSHSRQQTRKGSRSRSKTRKDLRSSSADSNTLEDATDSSTVFGRKSFEKWYQRQSENNAQRNIDRAISDLGRNQFMRVDPSLTRFPTRLVTAPALGQNLNPEILPLTSRTRVGRSLSPSWRLMSIAAGTAGVTAHAISGKPPMPDSLLGYNDQ
jgi:hypothetical protein